jgi:uncharacterized protein (DUF2249 family)
MHCVPVAGFIRQQAFRRIAPMPVQAIELDVRRIPPRDKHPSIFRAFDSLTSGQSLVLVNDHDPRPLPAS